MSVYRRRVMQVKHPPNQIKVVLDVTSTSSGTYLCKYESSSGSRQWEKILIDGEEVSLSTSGGNATYKFKTLGIHEVVFIMKKDKTYSGTAFFTNCSNHVSVDFSEFRTGFSDVQRMFEYCSKLESLKDFKVNNNHTSLYNLFFSCSKLQSLDVSKWDLSNVTSLNRTFYNCSLLENLDVSKWDTSNVTSLRETFYNCKALTNLDVSKWDTSNVTDMAQVFYTCSLLENLDLSNWDVSSVTNASKALQGCTKIANIDLSHKDFRKATNLSGLLQGCTNLQMMSLDNLMLPTSESADLSAMFSGITLNLDVSSVAVGGSLKGMFQGYKGANIVGLNSWDVSSVANMSGLFWECSNLSDFEGIRNWETSSVTDMSYLFYGRNNATNYPVEDWNVSNVKKLNNAFWDSFHLTSLNLSKWDVRNVETIENLFGFTSSRTENLKEVDLSSWNLEKCESVAGAFKQRSFRLILPDGFGRNCKDWSGLFKSYYNLASVDLTKIDTSSAENASDLFYGVGVTLDLTTWDLSKVTSWNRMFSYLQGRNELRMKTEINKDANLLTWSNNEGVFKDSIGSGSGVNGAKLYYFPYPSFVEKFLPIVPTKWEKIPTFTPEECTSLSITADNVEGTHETTTIYWTAELSGHDIDGNLVSGVIFRGEAESNAFGYNYGSEDIEKEVSFTYMGKTATTTIVQYAPVVAISAIYNVTDTTNPTTIIGNTFGIVEKYRIGGEFVDATTTYTFETLGEHLVEMFLKKDSAFTNMAYMFQRVTALKSVDLSNCDMSLVSGSSSTNSPYYMFSNASNLESVILPKTIKRLGDSMFSYCTKCSSLTILSATAPSVGNYSFGVTSADYIGATTKASGENKLYVPAGATGYASGKWADTLLKSTKCGFTKVEI